MQRPDRLKTEWAALLYLLGALVLLPSASGQETALDRERQRLDREQIAIDAERKSFNIDCAQVRSDDTAKIQSCNQRRQQILAQLRKYTEDLNAYEKRVRALEPLQPGPLPAPNSPGDPNNNRQDAGGPASEKFSKAAGEALRDSLTAQQTGNPQTKVEADKRLQKLSQEELQRLAQWQAEAHQEMLDDMQMLQANGDKYVIALEEAKARVRAKELTALKAADEKYHKDSSEYLRRLMGKEIKMKPEEVDAIIERRRAEQSAAVERAYYKMAAEVQRLKRQLLAETNGLPIIPSNPRTETDMELFLFSEPPPR